MQNQDPNEVLKNSDPVKIDVKIENYQTLQVLEKLEGFVDQDLAVKFLKSLNDKTVYLG